MNFSGGLKVIVMYVLFVGVFIWADGNLFVHLARGSSSPGNMVAASSAALTATDVAPTDAMVKSLTNAVGNVTGLNDMAVLPDGSGDGKFLVSAMVDIAQMGNGSPLNPTLQKAMESVVNTYFQDVYGADAPVGQAELTVTEDGQIIASAGLGRTAYQNLASTTMGGNLATTLLTSPIRDDHSADESWFQMKS